MVGSKNDQDLNVSVIRVVPGCDTPEDGTSIPDLYDGHYTCYKRGIFPRIAVEELAKDPDWSIFKPPEQERKEPAMLAAAAC